MKVERPEGSSFYTALFEAPLRRLGLKTGKLVSADSPRGAAVTLEITNAGCEVSNHAVASAFAAATRGAGVSGGGGAESASRWCRRISGACSPLPCDCTCQSGACHDGERGLSHGAERIMPPILSLVPIRRLRHVAIDRSAAARVRGGCHGVLREEVRGFWA